MEKNIQEHEDYYLHIPKKLFITIFLSAIYYWTWLSAMILEVNYFPVNLNDMDFSIFTKIGFLLFVFITFIVPIILILIYSD